MNALTANIHLIAGITFSYAVWAGFYLRAYKCHRFRYKLMGNLIKIAKMKSENVRGFEEIDCVTDEYFERMTNLPGFFEIFFSNKPLEFKYWVDRTTLIEMEECE